MFGKPCFLDRSSHVISIVTKSLDGVFGEVVIPGHPVVMEKLEQAIATASIRRPGQRAMSHRLQLQLSVLHCFWPIELLSQDRDYDRISIRLCGAWRNAAWIVSSDFPAKAGDHRAADSASAQAN